MKLRDQGWGKQVGRPLGRCKDFNIYPEFEMGATGEVYAEEWQDLTFSKDHGIKGSLVLRMSHGKASVKTGDANGVAPG